MTLEEFSNTLDTLLNSYGSQSQFGEEASKREVVLNEYEKSVILTQAQDIIVKSYFDATLNSQGQGFDDSIRRQVDFSSLIKVANLKAKESAVYVDWIDDEDTNFGKVKIKNITDSPIKVTFQLSSSLADEKAVFTYTPATEIASASILLEINGGIWASEAEASLTTVIEYLNSDEVKDSLNNVLHDYIALSVIKDTKANRFVDTDYTVVDTLLPKPKIVFDDRGTIFELPKKKDPKGEDIPETTEVLFLLNEKLKVNGQTYVIVPISYREYDREMSKAYAQPLKKQAWRLFQNISTGFDVNSELIPRWDISTASDFEYKIRYVRRPQPIILEKLPDGLTVDGLPGPSNCELNPILHMDIINKAVEIAINTRIGAAPQQQQQSR